MNKERDWSYPKGRFDWKKPYALPWGQWREWKKDMKNRYPIRYFFRETIVDFWTYNIVKPLRDVKWWFLHRLHPSYRYHVIRTSLEPGYYDPDTRIINAMFDLLVEFIDETKNTIDWDADERHKVAWEEMNELYYWWVYQRPYREEKLNKDYPLPNVSLNRLFDRDENDEEMEEWDRISKIHNNIETEWEEEDRKMLHRLIEIKSFLWYP